MLDGRVILTKHGQSAALPRVVLQAGSQFAVTDANGHFEFPSLKPGPYELNLKMDSIPSGVAMATPLPMKVNISPAGTTSVELTATPAASLSVSVMRYEFTTENLLTNSAELKLGGPEAAALVEITNGRETWREQTDRQGAVSFERLSAGVWMLRVLSNDPSPLRAVESPERTLSIAPGGNPRVLVRVLPVRRTLRMLDQGVIR